MDQEFKELSGRRHRRETCQVAASLRVAPEHADRVVIGRAGEAVPATITDFGEGGLGIRTAIFLPRGCALVLRLGEGLPAGGQDAPATIRVRRVRMTDRQPTYYLGASFDGPESERAGLLSALAVRA